MIGLARRNPYRDVPTQPLPVHAACGDPLRWRRMRSFQFPRNKRGYQDIRPVEHGTEWGAWCDTCQIGGLPT